MDTLDAQEESNDSAYISSLNNNGPANTSFFFVITLLNDIDGLTKTSKDNDESTTNSRLDEAYNQNLKNLENSIDESDSMVS